LAKGWFRDENLNPNSLGVWPFYDCNSRLIVPYLVEKDRCEFWNKADFVNRTVYFCNVVAEKKLEFNKFILKNFPYSYLEIKYEELIEDPIETIGRVSRFLGAEWGDLTSDRIQEIRPTEACYDIDRELDKCDPELKNKFYDLNSLLGYCE
jgi:hypothetical protein